MTNNNLRPEAGGDPANSNDTDVHDNASVTHDGNDFPDAPTPETNGLPQDKPDLDAFAARMGTDTIETGEGLDAVVDRSAAEPVADSKKIFAAAAFVAGLIGLVVWRRRRRSRVARLVETINVFD